MDLAFNDLSFLDYDTERGLLEKFNVLLKVFKNLKEQYGYKHLSFPSNYSQIQVTQDKIFSEWFQTIPRKEKNALLSIVKGPFQQEILEEDEDAVLRFYFVSDELGIEQEYCDGLATAYIKDMPAISLKNHKVWERTEIEIFEEREEENIAATVLNICDLDSLRDETISNYLDSVAIIDLQESTLAPHDKAIVLRDDHGKDKLTHFAKKINHNPYVIGVVNSLAFRPHTSRFIYDIKKNGLIEIVLHWDDRGIGMVVKTTGRNYRETKKIAELLKAEYDK